MDQDVNALLSSVSLLSLWRTAERLEDENEDLPFFVWIL